ncbi:MAG: UvrD-helicase domain-containing protein, partial [Gemmatimonadota bacterium]|nr:UvrD-helicase domain-containing protein [Gemmatimonadota bacterium]
MTTIPVTDPTVPLKAPKDCGDLHVLAFPLEAGVTLVEASAGTGKTFSIVFILIRLLLEGKVKSVDRALVVTFTNAATDELVTRVRAGLRRALAAYDGELPRDDDSRIWYDLAAQYAGRREVVATALASIDGLAVFTIHGFCKRVLEEHAVESDTPYRATFVEDAHDLLEVAALDWWRRTFYPDSRLACLAVAEGWLPDTWLELWNQWQRHPRTTVHPGAPTVEQACDALERVCEEICRTWSRERMAAALAGVDWSVKAPLGDQPIRVMNEAVEALRRGELEALGTLCDCAAEPLETAGKKTSKTARAALKALADDAFCAACGSIAGAVEQVRRALIADFMTSVTRDFEAEKGRRQALGFDDLLRRLHDGIEREGFGGALCGAIRGRYDAALIDEFQDTDPFQFPIFSTAFRERPLFLIGDPKQAIYGFRGADIFAYADAIRSADRRYTLPQNWRSTEGLIGAVNRLFGRAPRAFLRPADEIGFRDAAPAKAGPCPLADRREPLQWWFVPPEGDKACTKGAARQRLQRRAAAEIVSLLEQCEVEEAGELRRVR